MSSKTFKFTKLCKSNSQCSSFGFEESKTLINNINVSFSISSWNIVGIGYEPRSNSIYFIHIVNCIGIVGLYLESIYPTNAYCYNSNFINNSIYGTG